MSNDNRSTFDKQLDSFADRQASAIGLDFDPLATMEKENATPILRCPECNNVIWDLPYGHKLAKCWHASEHASGGTLAFDTMDDDDE